MNPDEAFKGRVQRMMDAVGGKKPLARLLGVTDSAVNSWTKGSKPFASTMREMCEHSGVSLEWFRDGIGDEEEEIAALRSGPSSRAQERKDSGDPDMTVHLSPRGKLQQALRDAGMNPSQLAKAISYDGGVIENVVNGSGRISEVMAAKICQALEGRVTVEDLTNGSDFARLLDPSGVTGTFGAKPNVRVPCRQQGALRAAAFLGAGRRARCRACG